MSCCACVYIDPVRNREFSNYKKEQSTLDGQSRRLQSVMARYTRDKEKEEANTENSHEALKHPAPQEDTRFGQLLRR